MVGSSADHPAKLQLSHINPEMIKNMYPVPRCILMILYSIWLLFRDAMIMMIC